MTHNEFNHIVQSLNALSPEQMQQLRRELDVKLASMEAEKPGQDLVSLLTKSAMNSDSVFAAT